MCGITGIKNLNGSLIDLNLLEQMTSTLSHRGPDGQGCWLSDNHTLGFGHRRLSIIDLNERAAQPMHYYDKRYTITYNGEIYNYIELRNSLIKNGYTFITESDTEVILASYHQKKESCLADFDGMFAFAIWDEKEQTLFCARDRFGEKPFYFHYLKNEHFVFASEMKAIWKGGITRNKNQKMFFNFMATGAVHNIYDLSETFYDGITKLKAAHYLFLKPDCDPIIKKYWEIDKSNTNNTISIEDAKANFRSLFETSVKRRLRSDVSVGSSLSGGLDSSLIVCMIDSLNHSDQNTFSARFKGFNRDEGAFMKMVIDKTKVTPHEVYPSEHDFIDNLDKLIFHQEEPFGSASIYAQYAVMKLAKENNIKVLLDGQGADEILAGYEFYYYYYFLELGRNNLRTLKTEFNAYKNQTVDFKQQLGRLFYAYVFIPGLYNSLNSLKRRQKFRKESVFNNDYLQANSKELISAEWQDVSSLNSVLQQSTTGGLLENLLRFADRNAMAHSREIRLPFLNHQLVEFIFSLPANYKINNGWRKYLMRITFEDLLPHGITWRKDKIGYTAPQYDWIKNKTFQERIYNSYENLVAEKILNKNVLEKEFLTNITKRENMNNIWNFWVADEFSKQCD